MPNIGSGAKLTFPAIMLGIVFVVLIVGAVMGNRFGERARARSPASPSCCCWRRS